MGVLAAHRGVMAGAVDVSLTLRTARRVAPETVEWGEPATVAGAGIAGVLAEWEQLVRGLDEDVDTLEGHVLSTTRMYRVERLYNLMREVLRLHRAIARVLLELEPDEPELRAVHARAQRLLAHVDELREQLLVALQIHQTRSAARLAQVSVHHAELATRENEQMRKIAAWAAILGIPTLIAGLYGMNFRHMPELGWSLGYPLVIAVMIGLCAGLFAYFRRIDWL